MMGRTTAANSLNAQVWFLNAGHQIHASGNTECTAEMSRVSSVVFTRDKDVWDANRNSYLLTELSVSLSKTSFLLYLDRAKGGFHSDGVQGLFWVPKNPFSEYFLKEPFFY